nr:hypothetical protein [Methylobacterium nodulans]
MRLLALPACAGLLAAVTPLQARPLIETYAPTACFTCGYNQRAEPLVVSGPYGARESVRPSGRQRFTRFDIEALRLMTRMR